MIDEIYDKIKEEQINSANYYNIELGLMDESEKITGTTGAANIDLLKIFTKIGLIEDTYENLDIISEYYDYVFKLGIEMGINSGAQLMIEAIKSNYLDLKTAKKINPDDCLNFDLKPQYVYDMLDDMENE